MKRLRRILHSLIYDPLNPDKPISEEAKEYVVTPARKKKDGRVKKLIPIITPLQKLQLASGANFRDLGISFRYVSYNPPRQQCPRCKKLNNLDENSCQFCSEIMSIIV
jgi:hypothetical protein